MTISKLVLCLFTSALFMMCAHDIAGAQDPYKDVTFHTLSNGMDVVLAPGSQAQNVKVKVRVNVGKAVEHEETLGVSHLLEHLLFRDSRFNDEQTYSDLIKENGGTINASVSRDETVYYATIPSQKAEWLVEEFVNMLFNHTIEQDAIERAQSSVQLEIGEPSWLADHLGIDLYAILIQRYFPAPDFFESEFGMRRALYSRNEYRLSNRRLTKDLLQAHYLSYYYPSNMVLFLTGNFDAEKMIVFIEEKFGTHPDRTGKTIPALEPEMNNKPYRRVEHFQSSSPYIYIGTKYLNISPQENMSLMVYHDYLAHRIMKELRNRRGETYTAQVYEDDQYGAGYSLVAFETQHAEYEKNLQYVSSLIEQETMNGALTDIQVREALTLTKQQRYELAESDADSIMVYAEHYYDYVQDFGIADSPYTLIRTITPDEVRESLKHIYKKDNYYTHTYIPYIYSKIESAVIYILALIGSIVFFQRMLKRKVDETLVKWTQKMSYTPAMFFEVIACLIYALLLSHLISAPIDRAVYTSAWYHSASLWPAYVYGFLTVMLITGMFMGLLAVFPRKIMIEGDAIVLKSMALYARRFERASIKSISAVSLRELLMSPGTWLNSRFRFFYNTCFIWRKGLLLELWDGPTYFLEFKKSDHVSTVLNRHFFTAEEDTEPGKPAQLTTDTADSVSTPFSVRR